MRQKENASISECFTLQASKNLVHKTLCFRVTRLVYNLETFKIHPQFFENTWIYLDTFFLWQNMGHKN